MATWADVFSTCFALVNLPSTLFLCVMLLYWLSVVIGMLDLNLFHIDTDVHTDVPADVHADVHAEAHADIQ